MVEAHLVKSSPGITDSADSLAERKGRVPRRKCAELFAGPADNIRRTVAGFPAEGYPDIRCGFFSSVFMLLPFCFSGKAFLLCKI